MDKPGITLCMRADLLLIDLGWFARDEVMID